MKILTKEEEQAHYDATIRGGFAGGAAGFIIGGAAAYGANLRFPTFRSLTLPMKVFLVSSSTTFASIINADRYSRAFEMKRDPSRQYKDRASQDMAAAKAQETSMQKIKDWGRENRYPIITTSWLASMGIALGLVGKNPYLTKAQKLVQARVYAQFLTLGILIATAALETVDASKGKGRWETVMVLDPNDPSHKHMVEKKIHHEAYEGEDLWRDMVAAEERKLEARKDAVKKQEEEDHTKSKTPTPQAKGKENKDKISAESKSAGKVDYKEAEEIERKNMQTQSEKQTTARKEAVADDVKVSDRG